MRPKVLLPPRCAEAHGKARRQSAVATSDSEASLPRSMASPTAILEQIRACHGDGASAGGALRFAVISGVARL